MLISAIFVYSFVLSITPTHNYIRRYSIHLLTENRPLLNLLAIFDPFAERSLGSFVG